MANTKKISSVSKTTEVTVERTRPTFEKNLIKKMKTRRAFAGLTYANNIIGVIAFIFSIVALFGAASAYSQPKWWVGFWTVNTIFSGNPSFLSVIGIATIFIDSIFCVLVISQVIGNLILKNKIKLLFATRVSCILLAATMLMMILGLCSQPSFEGPSLSTVYISWIRYLIGNATHLSSGAIIILIQMVLVFAYCLARVIFYFVVEAKKYKVKKDISKNIKKIKEQSQTQE